MSLDIVPNTRFSEAPLAFVTEQIEDDIIDGVCRDVEAGLFPRLSSLHLKPRLHSSFDTFNEALLLSRFDGQAEAETLRTVYFIDLRQEDNPYVARVLFCVTENFDDGGFKQYAVDCIITYSPCNVLEVDDRTFGGLSGLLTKVRVGRNTSFPYYW